MSYLQKCHCYISSSARRSTRRRSCRRSSTSVSTRRADEPSPSCSHTRPYPHGVVLVFAIPFPSTRSRRAELELSAVAGVDPGHSRHPASIRCIQSRFASPRTHSTPPRARSCPTQAEIEPQQPSAIAVHRAPPPSPPSFPLRPFSAQIDPSVSSPATSSRSPTCPPLNPAPPPPFCLGAAAGTRRATRACRGPPLRGPPQRCRAPCGRRPPLVVPRRLTAPAPPAAAGTPPPTSRRRHARVHRHPSACAPLCPSPRAPPQACPALATDQRRCAAGRPPPARHAAAAGWPDRAPAVARAGKTEELRVASHLHVGPACQPFCFIFVFQFQLFYFGCKIFNCLEIHRKMRKMPNKFC